jgi:hypothetical protein
MSGDHNMNQNDFKPDWDTVKAFDDRHNEDTALLQQCLEALNRSDYLGWQFNIPIIKELRERLTQTTMQPCAGRNCGSTNPNLHSAECFEDYEKSTGMREWKGLTDEEVMNCYLFWVVDLQDIIGFYKGVETKLKERNA